MITRKVTAVIPKVFIDILSKHKKKGTVNIIVIANSSYNPNANELAAKIEIQILNVYDISQLKLILELCFEINVDS